ncbi:hypothetical protein ACFL4L_00005, partial [bacterium]
KNNKDKPQSSQFISLQGLNHTEFEKLVGDVIHKMKNNLGGISGFSTLLERDLGEDSPHVRLIEQIQHSVVRLDDLVVDLMVLIRKAKPTRHNVSVKPLLNDIITQYQDQNQLKCKVVYPLKNSSDKLIIQSDSFILERVFRYIVRFIEYAKAILKSIHIEIVNEKTTKIDIQIDHLELDGYGNKDLIEIISDYEPVEARLAFAILVKLVDALNGHVSARCNSETSMKLSVEIS